MGSLQQLTQLGLAPWLDSISREWLDSGELERMRDEYSLRGVTSNPSIFQAALAHGTAYDSEIVECASEGLSVRETFHRLAIADIQRACDVFAQVHAETGDGHVSIELDPDLANDVEASIVQARELSTAIDRPNVMIKVPGTQAGLPVIEQLLSEGISVNVTLLFGVAAYRDVMEAWLRGLEQLAAAGGDLSKVASVASFFVSRVDTKVDPMLAGIDGGKKIAGKVAVANASIAWQVHQEVIGNVRFLDLAAQGATVQRPLWASTGTKNAEYSDIMYVQELIAGDTVNTMPLATIKAFADHGTARVTIDEASIAGAHATLTTLAELGINLTTVTDELRDEGVAAFEKSFETLLAGIEKSRSALA